MIPQDQLVDIAIDLAKHIVTKYGYPMAKNLWEQAQQAKIQKPSFVLKGDLVNRESVMRAINAALDARNTTRVIYLYGPGGAGKTRLLEEVSWKTAKSTASFRWAGIFDLYHTDLHNVLRLQSTIIEGLDIKGQHFTSYREAKENLDSKRRDGIFSLSSDATIQSEIASLNQLFIDELNQFTSAHRVVLAFDTLENIGEEQDLVRRVFRLGQGRDSFSARQWLLDLCQNAKNIVILLAGRPNEELKSDLEQINALHIGRVESISIQGLTQTEIASLLDVYSRNIPRPVAELLAQNAVMIWQTTKGLPVHVALTVELVLQAPQILENESNGNEPELGRKIVRAYFDSEDPDKRHLFFLALARKGLTSELLNSLERKWPKEECSKRLSSAEKLTVIKKRHGESELFLHDALYEMFDSFLPYSEEEKTHWFQRLFEYYQGEQLSEKEDRSHWEKSTINLLYYDLRCDFLRAFYRNYVHWSEIAIKGYEMELDIQLLNEVLVFMRNDIKHKDVKAIESAENAFIQDSATRWIKRLIMQAQYDRAIELAETFLAFGSEYSSLVTRIPLIGISEENKVKLKESITSAPPIFWACLLTYYGESLTYVAMQSEIQVGKIFQRAITLLEGSSFNRDNPLWWFRNRLSGRTYDRLGYSARVNGHYQTAVAYYRKALDSYESTGILDEFAFTQNNLAFVLALLGDITGAKIAAEDALTKRLGLGQRYPLALSYNTRGLIRALDNPNSFDGQWDCELALSVFEEINTPRGIGLACNALGFILGRRGGGWISRQCTPEQAIQWYAESERYFERAKEIFKDGEKIRFWEAYNELGSLNRDWACLLNSMQDAEDARQKLTKSLDYQAQALKLAQDNHMRFQEVDTLDDIAEVYLDLGNFEEAKKNLENCRALIPSEFNLDKAKERPLPGDVYWLSLAKIQLREGIMNVRLARHNAPHDSSQVVVGIRQLLTSFIHSQLYSSQPNYLGQKTREIVSVLKELTVPGEMVGDAFRQVVGEYDFDLSALCSALSKGYTYEEFS